MTRGERAGGMAGEGEASEREGHLRTTSCPTCRGAVVKDGNKHYPFCSERCHMVDLGRWFGEEYRVPGEPADPALIAAAEGNRDPDPER